LAKLTGEKGKIFVFEKDKKMFKIKYFMMKKGQGEIIWKGYNYILHVPKLIEIQKAS